MADDKGKTAEVAPAEKSTVAPPTKSPPGERTPQGNDTNAPIEVDADIGDHDSVIDDQISAFTASLTSSVTDYPVEHGRSYHAFRSGAYPLPNDETEMNRLDITHEMITRGMGDKLYLAPIDHTRVHRILDIGTGNGLWAMLIADSFPSATVLGNDLSPTQPSWVPPNCKFEVDDLESPWTHDAPFDWIFSRYMTASIKDWPKLVQTIYDNLAPGGWAEFEDFDLQYYSEDGSMGPDNDLLRWINLTLHAAHKTGRDPQPGAKLEGWVRAAGFDNVVHQRFKLPIGPWAKDARLKAVGMFNMLQIQEGLEAFSFRLFEEGLGWRHEEVVVLLAKVRKALRDPGLHAQFDLHVVYGQKALK